MKNLQLPQVNCFPVVHISISSSFPLYFKQNLGSCNLYPFFLVLASVVIEKFLGASLMYLNTALVFSPSPPFFMFFPCSFSLSSCGMDPGSCYNFAALHLTLLISFWKSSDQNWTHYSRYGVTSQVFC